MQEAVPEGTGLMAAILGMERQDVEKTCLEAAKNGIVGPANYNSPGQIVIAGEKKAVEKAMELAKAAGAKKVIPLAVSVPSHCAMMQKAGERLAQELERVTISDLRIPIVNNADAKFLRTAAELKPSLIRQISSPLYWEDSIRNMAADGCDTFIEIGPGKVLSGLVKRIAKDVKGAERRRPEEHERYACMRLASDPQGLRHWRLAMSDHDNQHDCPSDRSASLMTIEHCIRRAEP